MLDRRILDATSVAVVGASRTPTKRGFQAIRTLQHQGFEGAIYPVNPKVDTIAGLKCYPKVSDIPGPVDVAPELLERMDGIEVQLAAHEEQTAKRLDETEARALHLLEQRLGAVEEELSGSLRRLLERALEKESRALRTRIALVGVRALAAGAVGSVALLAALGRIAL